MKDKLYSWWKKRPGQVRKSVVFTVGILLLCLSPIVGTIPGPGGIGLFLLSIAILASEFDWAQQLKSFFLNTVPKEVSDRWKPTPKWQFWTDIIALLLLIGALIFAVQHIWLPVVSFSAAGFCLALFNRDRLGSIKKHLKKSR